MLLGLLVAYQIIWDYLDSVHETQPDHANGICLHQALSDACGSHAPLCDYYRQHQHSDDGLYLHALVLHSRQSATRLASYNRVQLAIQRQAASSAIALSINHEPDATRRLAKMRLWATEHGGEKSVTWFELTAAAAAALGMFALLAEATSPACSERDLSLITDAYVPWACSTATMLDSYADRDHDAENDQHIYIDYYRSRNEAIDRTGRLVRESIIRAQDLPRGNTHAVILASMVAMYLTRTSSQEAARHQETDQLARSGGSLTRLLIPALKMWRAIYQLSTA